MYMQIVSINVAQPVTIRFNGEDVLTGLFKKPVDGQVSITPMGLAGDAIIDKSVHGGLDQAVYLYHKEDYDWWSNELGRDIPYGTFGENLTLAGSDDIAWVIGDRLEVNGVVLEITAPRTPCFKLAVRMDDSGFMKKFANAVRPGAYARVIKEGSVAVGNSISVEKTTMDYATVKEIFELWHSNNKSTAILIKSLSSPIAPMHRAKIQGWYDQLMLQS
jgi:MOSC domain-containing protein YiiM